MDQVNELMNPSFYDTYIIPWLIKAGVALVIFVVGKYIARMLVNISRRVMERGGMDPMLVNFLGNILNALLLAVVAIAALDQLGVETTSLLAVLGAAGLAIGLALKDSLSNFSSGVMLIIFRPFKAGDFVEAAGVAGVIEHVGIFNTTMRTGDNREIIVPNSHIYGGTITNVSARETRRIDLVIGIGYNDDIRKAREILEGILKGHELILEDPAPAVSVAELGDSSININVRPWVKSGDYWPVRADLLETIKVTFDDNGISIPFPQRDVHLYNENTAA